MMEALPKYGQTKFLLHGWSIALSGALPWLDVVVHSPGPIFTDLGREHVPPALVPTYTLMKLALFPTAEVASRPVAALAIPTVYPDGTFMHIREDRTKQVIPGVLDPKTHTWLRDNTVDALRALSYGGDAVEFLPSLPAQSPPEATAQPAAAGRDEMDGALPPASNDAKAQKGERLLPAEEIQIEKEPEIPAKQGSGTLALDNSVRSLGTRVGNDCIDTLGSEGEVATLGLYTCHESGGNQGFWVTPEREIRVLVKHTEMCLDAWGPMPALIHRGICHSEGGNQAWLFDESGAIRHGPDSVHPDGCIDAFQNEDGSRSLVVAPCDSARQEQLWNTPEVVLRNEL